MNSRPLARFLVPVVGGFGLVLAACSPGIEDSTQEGETLAEYLGYTPYSTDFTDPVFSRNSSVPEPSEADRRDHARVEDLISECMRIQGFEYVPRPLPTHPAGDLDDAYALGPTEFAERYGYGITTLALSPDAEADDDDDPNERIRDSLSPAAQRAYDAALWGGNETDREDQDVSSPGQRNGCYEESYLEVHGSFGTTLDEVQQEFGSLLDDVHALSERIRHHPQVTAAVEEWRQCLADSGYPGFEDLYDPQESIHTQAFDAASEPSSPDAAVPAGSGVMVRGDTRFVIDAEKFAELQDHELELAAADVACRRPHSDAYQQVALEMEQEFIEAHRAELERYRDFHTGNGGTK